MGFKLFLLLEKFLMILPKSFRKSFFTMLATIAYHASARYRNVAYKNLDFAFNDKMTKKEKDEIVKYSFKNLLYNFLHLMEIRHMSKEELASKVTIQNIEAVKKAHEEKRPVIYVTPHYSAWELGGASIGLLLSLLQLFLKK